MLNVEDRPRIFCDLDGTLLDVREKYWNLYQKASTQFGLVLLSRQLYWRRRRMGWSERRVIESCNTPSSSIEGYLTFWKEQVESPKFVAYDRLIPSMRQLAAVTQRFDLILVTMRQNQDVLLDQLKKLNVDRFLRGIQSRGLIQNRLAAGSLCQKKDLLQELYPHTGDYVIGDTEEDAEMAIAYSVSGFLVTSGMRSPNMLQSYAPPLVLRASIRSIFHELLQ